MPELSIEKTPQLKLLRSLCIMSIFATYLRITVIILNGRIFISSLCNG